MPEPRTEGLASLPRFTPASHERQTEYPSNHLIPARNPVASPATTINGQLVWALVPVLSLGVLLPFPFAYAAVRLHGIIRWGITIAYSFLWFILLIVIIVQGSLGHVAAAINSSVSLLVFAILVTAHALRLRRRVFAAR
jgi:hypothetical protein